MNWAAIVLIVVLVALALGLGRSGSTRLTGDPFVPWEDEEEV